ncbi:hypothetical protein [Lentzea sp. NPDC051838]|uniref:hypothetical protein n=1 Tax=Lentzea sp. NPDC051838 TaxID=3154849 RepID=UPI0034174A5B
MTIELPPRRALPADVKERMRPAFTETRPRRGHTPLAVAAGVALLVAGGVTVTQTFFDRTDSGNARVVAPSRQDVNRCRAAMNDENWSSSKMVVFDSHKVLVGKDNRFCELTRSRAHVILQNTGQSPPGAGSVTFRSDHVIAGVPPLDARTAVVHDGNEGSDRPSTDAVVTRDFFVSYSAAPRTITEVLFDDRTTVTVPSLNEVQPAAITDSFESGDGNAWTPVNLLSRCADNAAAAGSRFEELKGWQPLLTSGLDGRDGLLLAQRDNREWATCLFSSFTSGGTSLEKIYTVPADPQGVKMVSGHTSLGTFIMAARTSAAARTVEVSKDGGPAVTADVTDGFFIVKLPSDGSAIDFGSLRVTARDADNQIVFSGGVT